ncbi:hypothetical protein SGLAM104S_07790 [Streptomyces glaucescens]
MRVAVTVAVARGGLLLFLLLDDRVSVVRNSAAIDAAFCSAERVTLAGSMMPSLTRSTYSPVAAFRPWPGVRLRTFSTTTPPSRPAFTAICFSGASSASFTAWAPVASSPSSSSFSKTWEACSRATPPPATMPSSTAAFALRTASSMRRLRSLSSTSVAAPALMTATPPASFARRSWSFSRS